jgi:hypothetical protein
MQNAKSKTGWGGNGFIIAQAGRVVKAVEKKHPHAEVLSLFMGG